MERDNASEHVAWGSSCPDSGATVTLQIQYMDATEYFIFHF